MDIEPGRIQPFSLQSSFPPLDKKTCCEGDMVDRADIGSSASPVHELCLTPAKAQVHENAHAGSSTRPLFLHLGPVPSTPGPAFHALGLNALIDWINGKKTSDTQGHGGVTLTAIAPPDAIPPDAQGKEADELRRLGDDFIAMVGKPAGNSSFLQRYELFQKAVSMITRTHGRGGFEVKKAALEQYDSVTGYLGDKDDFCAALAIYARIASSVSLSEHAQPAFSMAYKKLRSSPKKQEAFLAILKNTRDYHEAKKMYNRMNRFSLAHKWEDRRDAMIALTDVFSRMTMEYFAPKPKLIAIEAYKMISWNLLPGENIKDAAKMLADYARPFSRAYEYKDICAKSIQYYREIRQMSLPLEEKKLYLDCFTRFHSDKGAGKVCAIVKRPSGNASFKERADMMRKIMEGEEYCTQAINDYAFLRGRGSPGESVLDMAARLAPYIEICGALDIAAGAGKAWLFVKDELKEDGKETAFFTSLLKMTGKADRGIDLYRLIAREPALDMPHRNEERDERREIFRVLIGQYLESENSESARGGRPVENESIMQSASGDFNYIKSMTRDGVSLNDTLQDYLSYIKLLKTDDFSKEAQQAFSFVQDELKGDPVEAAIFKDLLGHIGRSEKSIALSRRIATLEILEQQVEREPREERLNLFAGLVKQYSSADASDCLSLASRDYKLIAGNKKPGEALADAAGRIQAVAGDLRKIETLHRGDPINIVVMVEQLKGRGETLDDACGRIAGIAKDLEKQSPFNQYDDIHFFDYKKPIYDGLIFVAENVANGNFCFTTPEKAIEEMKAALTEKFINGKPVQYDIEDIKELMLARAQMNRASQPGQEKDILEVDGDMVSIRGVRLNRRGEDKKMMLSLLQAMKVAAPPKRDQQS